MNGIDDLDRKPRFALDPTARRSVGHRAASQPARNEPLSDPVPPLLSVQDAQGDVAAGNGNDNAVWVGSPLRSEFGEASWPSRMAPVRSASFSVTETQPHHEPAGHFPSTFEDEEDEAYDEGEESDSPRKEGFLSAREAFSRSRSQSMAVEASRSSTLPPPGSAGLARKWQESPSSNSYAGDDTSAEVQSGRRPSVSPVRRSGQRPRDTDLSNMSPFVRDVNQILMDDDPIIRETWGAGGGTIGWREDNGGGSGTTSRRHSVSIVPRRTVSGFAVAGDSEFPGSHGEADDRENNKLGLGTFGTGALRISDEDLMSGLGSLSLHGPPPTTSSRSHAPSHPASLPAYPPAFRSYRATSAISHSPEGATAATFPQHINQSAPRSHLAPYSSTRTPSFGTATSGDDGRSSSGTGTSPAQSHDFNMNRGRADVQYMPGARTPSAGRQIRPLDMRGDAFRADAAFVPSSPADYASSPLARMYQSGFAAPPAHLPQLPRLHTGSMTVSTRSPLSPTGPSFARPQQSPYTPSHPHHRHSADPISPLSDLGRGVPLHAVPKSDPLYIVEFKAGRTDIYYCPDKNMIIREGDLVIVEADRGKDLGKIVNDSITLADVEVFQRQASDPNRPPGLTGTRDAYLAAALTGPLSSSAGGPLSPTLPGAPKSTKEIMPKRIYAKAQPQETQLLVAKMHDEAKALQLCQTKVRQKRLPMEVVDAEFQWDRRKLTFYFVADKRIDFRELVRELFRLYKTRIWMACLGENMNDFAG